MSRIMTPLEQHEMRIRKLESSIRWIRFCLYPTTIAVIVLLLFLSLGCQGPGHYRVGDYTLTITAPPKKVMIFCYLCGDVYYIPQFSGVPQDMNDSIQERERQKHRKTHRRPDVFRRPAS